MPLATCRDCGLQVSDSAASCPRCGRVFHRRSQLGGCAQLTIGGIAIAVLAAFCSALGPEETPEQRRAQEARSIASGIEYNAKQAVKAQLRDPASAQFGDIHVVEKNGIRAACGTVNARNGFGGYTGHTQFVAVGGGQIAMLRTSGNDREFVRLWNDRCVGGGPVVVPAPPPTNSFEADLQRASQPTPQRR